MRQSSFPKTTTKIKKSVKIFDKQTKKKETNERKSRNRRFFVLLLDEIK